MKKWILLALVATGFVLLAEIAWPTSVPVVGRVFRRKKPLRLPEARPTGSCQSVDDLPDPVCTPGEIDRNVTQENIEATICVKAYTKKVRPPTAYTNPLKVQQIGEYGFGDTAVVDYEEDHLIPLELGGHPTDPRNLWPEPGHSPNPKDAVEGKLHRLVCAGEISLTEAQTRIRFNWKTALQ